MAVIRGGRLVTSQPVWWLEEVAGRLLAHHDPRAPWGPLAREGLLRAAYDMQVHESYLPPPPHPTV